MTPCWSDKSASGHRALGACDIESALGTRLIRASAHTLGPLATRSAAQVRFPASILFQGRCFQPALNIRSNRHQRRGSRPSAPVLVSLEIATHDLSHHLAVAMGVGGLAPVRGAQVKSTNFFWKRFFCVCSQREGGGTAAERPMPPKARRTMHHQCGCTSQKPKPKQKPVPEQRCKTQIDSSPVTTQVAIRVG